MKTIKYKNLFGISYTVFLIALTAWFLLSTFVIVKKYETVEAKADTTKAELAASNAITTANSYEDEKIKITLETIEKYDTQIYIADVQLSSIDYLQSAFAENSYGRNIVEDTSEIADNNNAILAINGDYYGFRDKGFVLRNGVLYRDKEQTTASEDLVIYDDGRFEIINENDADAEGLLDDGALQIYSFGPGLIDDGKLIVDTSTEISSHADNSNPRTAIGMIDELHYIFVVSDGRTDTSAGLTLYELASIMKNYGYQVAYN